MPCRVFKQNHKTFDDYKRCCIWDDHYNNLPFCDTASNIAQRNCLSNKPLFQSHKLSQYKFSSTGGPARSESLKLLFNSEISLIISQATRFRAWAFAHTININRQIIDKIRLLCYSPTAGTCLITALNHWWHTQHWLNYNRPGVKLNYTHFLVYKWHIQTFKCKTKDHNT